MLYVSGDEIYSLRMFENIKFKRLEEFWAIGDIQKRCIESIEEIRYLKGKETIKKIVFNQNRIKDIDRIVDIVPSFPNLELLSIKNNNIPKEKIEKVIQELKEKGIKKLRIEY